MCVGRERVDFDLFLVSFESLRRQSDDDILVGGDNVLLSIRVKWGGGRDYIDKSSSTRMTVALKYVDS